MKRPEKYRKVTIAIAKARCNKLEVDPSLSTKPNHSHLDRLQQRAENEIEIDIGKMQKWQRNRKWRHAGSRLSRLPSAKTNEIVKLILQAMSTTSMPRSAGTGE